MNQEGFRELYYATSLALRCEDPEILSQTGRIDIDDIQFGIFFEPSAVPNRIICYLDLGPVDQYDREEILTRLLELNVISGSKTAGVYGLNKETNTILFIQHFMYPELLLGEEFATILQSYALHAINLRKTLLDPAYKDSSAEALRQSFVRDSNHSA